MQSSHPILLALIGILGAAVPCAGGSGSTAPAARGDPEMLWDYATPGVLPQTTVADGRRPYLYAATKNGGLLVLKTPEGRGRPVKAAQLPPLSFGGMEVMNLVKAGDRLYVALGNFFNARGAEAGLAIVDVAAPDHPRVTAKWRSIKLLRGAAAVATDGRFAYLAAMSAGVIVFDVSDETRITETARLLPDIQFPRRDPGRVQHPNVRGLALAGDRLYVADDAGGLRVIDVANKRRPREIGRYINGAMLAKQQAYNNVVLDGPRAYVALDYCGLEILDVADPAAIRQLGWWNPWGCDKATNIWFNSPGHVNQLVLDKARNAVLLSAGDSELRIVDVADPAHPRLVGGFGEPRNKRGVWGVSANGGTVYLTYIRAFIPFAGRWAGIRALKWPASGSQAASGGAGPARAVGGGEAGDEP